LATRDRSGQAALAEGGIGASVTSCVYRSGRKHFSTEFNFGTTSASDTPFGAARKNELVLRTEHFSNAGIERSENFVQLRYAHCFD
jgi:lipid A 3-O-deacylase